MCYKFPMSDDEQRDEGEKNQQGGEVAVAAEALQEREVRRAWWLSTRRHRPEWQSLAGAGTATFGGRPRSHYTSARPGDPVLVYLARPDHAIRAVGVVTRGSEGHTAERNAKPDSAPQIEIQLAFELPGGLPWRAIRDQPLLEGAEPVRQRSSGSLFALTHDEYMVLQAMIEERNPELAPSFAAIDSGSLVLPASRDGKEDEGGDRSVLREGSPPYSPTSGAALPSLGSSLPWVRSLEELEDLTGLPLALLEEARDLVRSAGQVVLTGPPGTGKTWLARGLAALVAGDPARVAVTQFHPGTTYEDFIEGLKPRVDSMGRVSYAVLPGLFLRVCEAARLDRNNTYVLLVDEINRAPLSRVFGELLYALEYRGPEGAVELSVSAGMGHSEPFYVPENLLIIGTMNSADRSLAILDYALRRRFRFLELEPNAAVLDRWLARHGASAARRRVVLDLFSEVNRRLSETLDPDHRLGHTYFMLDPLTGASLDRLWKTALKPLLQEYFIPPAGEIEEYTALFRDAAEEVEEF